MKTLPLTFGISTIVILGMAVGCISSERTVKGSYGDIPSLDMKEMYGCDTPCDTLQKGLGKKQYSDDQGIRVDH